MCNNNIYFILFILLICLCLLSIVSKSKSYLYELCMAASKIKNNKSVNGGSEKYIKPNSYRIDTKFSNRVNVRKSNEHIEKKLTVFNDTEFPPERLF